MFEHDLPEKVDREAAEEGSGARKISVGSQFEKALISTESAEGASSLGTDGSRPLNGPDGAAVVISRRD